MFQAFYEASPDETQRQLVRWSDAGPDTPSERELGRRLIARDSARLYIELLLPSESLWSADLACFRGAWPALRSTLLLHVPVLTLVDAVVLDYVCPLARGICMAFRRPDEPERLRFHTTHSRVYGTHFCWLRFSLGLGYFELDNPNRWKPGMQLDLLRFDHSDPATEGVSPQCGQRVADAFEGLRSALLAAASVHNAKELEAIELGIKAAPAWWKHRKRIDDRVGHSNPFPRPLSYLHSPPCVGRSCDLLVPAMPAWRPYALGSKKSFTSSCRSCRRSNSVSCSSCAYSS